MKYCLFNFISDSHNILNMLLKTNENKCNGYARCLQIYWDTSQLTVYNANILNTNS